LPGVGGPGLKVGLVVGVWGVQFGPAAAAIWKVVDALLTLTLMGRLFALNRFTEVAMGFFLSRLVRSDTRGFAIVRIMKGRVFMSSGKFQCSVEYRRNAKFITAFDSFDCCCVANAKEKNRNVELLTPGPKVIGQLANDLKGAC